MQARYWSGWRALLLLVPALSMAQPSSIAADDVMVDLADHAPLTGVKLTQPAFDQIVSNLRTDGRNVRADLLAEKMRYLDDVHACCKLTDEQFEKLKLAIRVDNALFMQTYSRLQGQYVDAVLPLGAYRTARLEIFQQLTVPLHRRCDERSFFYKVLRRQASREQWMQFERLDRGRREALVKSHLTALLAGPHSLRDDQLEVVISRLLTEYPAWEPFPQRIEHARFVSMLAFDAQFEKLKPVLTEPQIDVVQKAALMARQTEPTLRTLGLWPLRTE